MCFDCPTIAKPRNVSGHAMTTILHGLMMYEKIPFDRVKAEVESIFPTATLDKWDLVPDSIHKLADNAGIKLQWNKIDWWTSFEYGHIDVSDDKFFSVLFEQVKPTDTKVIIVTDECFKDKLAYYLDFKDLIEFAATTYPDIHQMDFFQPHDFIFIFPVDRLLTILHHEGYVMQFKSTKT